MYAVENGHYRTALYLMNYLGSKGADAVVNRLDPHGWNALFFAVYDDHTLLVQMLLEDGGFDIEHKNSNGETVLFIAVERVHLNIVNTLIEMYDAGIDVVNNDGLSIVDIAYETDDDEMLSYLRWDSPDHIQRIFRSYDFTSTRDNLMTN